MTRVLVDNLSNLFPSVCYEIVCYIDIRTDKMQVTIALIKWGDINS
jgi:hypothetical protein